MTDLDHVFDTLFPICRSITGGGYRQSLDILRQHIPFDLTEVPSGTHVHDWTVPHEWTLRRATLRDESGALIIDSDLSNLHVLNFSEPFKGRVSRAELDKHLHSIAEWPDAIPYVTSYYQPRWGLCISHNQRQALQGDYFDVDIDVVKEPGALVYGHTVLPGKSDKRVLLSSYLCHPSMANNELSGPLAMIRLYEQLKARSDRLYTYEFVILPETIGSICFLADHGKRLQKQMIAGLVLTCLGGPPKKLSYKLSRRDWLDTRTPLDKLARHLARYHPDLVHLRDFTPVSGSDERQYCSPGYNLPMVQVLRSIYTDNPHYHSSMDNKAYMTIEAVEDAADQIGHLLSALEVSAEPLINQVQYGEPQLGKRGLYPTLNSYQTRRKSDDGANPMDQRQALRHILNILSLSDGERDMIDIAEKLDASMLDLAPIAQNLAQEGVLGWNALSDGPAP